MLIARLAASSLKRGVPTDMGARTGTGGVVAEAGDDAATPEACKKVIIN
ncbi:hypothetical protein ACXITP_00030 [Actinotignum sanguinis]|nr:hypothetical protein [Actinotignum sanguinis]MDY5137400.1 hypothetical protein [Actinotignum sanguinis]